MSLNGKCGTSLLVHTGDGPSRSDGRHLKCKLWTCLVLMTGVATGCGGSGDSSGSPAGTKSSGPAKGLVFVGFDASEVLVDAMRQGKIQGLVVQNPLRMGKLSVETMVKHLEKQAIEKQISTGETLVTPQNMKDPDVAPLIHPPQVDNASDASLSGTKAKKYRVIVIPKGTTHEFWKTLHAGTLQAAKELGNVEVIWQGPQKEDDRVLQIQLVQNAVAAGVDGIVIAPLDSRALVEPIEAAIAKGIPVLIFDSALESTKPVSYVATNNYHGGVLAAQRMGEATQRRRTGDLAALRGWFREHGAAGEGVYRHACQGVSQDQADFRLGIRRPDFRLGPAESPEPGDAISRAGRRDLLPQRVEHLRDAAGSGRCRDALRWAVTRSGGKARCRASGNARREQGVRSDTGTRLRVARAGNRRSARLDRRERCRQEHADEDLERRHSTGFGVDESERRALRAARSA